MTWTDVLFVDQARSLFEGVPSTTGRSAWCHREGVGKFGKVLLPISYRRKVKRKGEFHYLGL